MQDIQTNKMAFAEVNVSTSLRNGYQNLMLLSGLGYDTKYYFYTIL